MAVTLAIVTNPQTSFDLNQVVREAVFMLTDFIDPVVPDLQLASGVVPIVGIGVAAIARILMNLTRNARNAMRGNRNGDSELVIGTEICGLHSAFWVSDNGCGLSAAQLARFAEPIGDHNGDRGHGLLSVRATVQAIGGVVSVASSPETGTTFRVVLPSGAGGLIGA